ncbi:MAG: hypothetical protein Q8Q33_06380, partial [Chlamydiota bacterium]|nr:hypothetical protein [Chlamydiota bacterium]
MKKLFNKQNINRIITAIVFLFTLILLMVPVSAQTNPAPASTESYTLLAPLPCIETYKTVTDAFGNTSSVREYNCKEGNLSLSKEVPLKDYVQYAVNLLIALAAAAAVFMIVWGGFLYMTSSIAAVKTDGIAKATNAVIGLLMVLASYLILRTINPRFVELPTSLVPPLELHCPNNPNLKYNDVACKRNTSMDFLDLLDLMEAEADYLRSKSIELGKAVEAAKQVRTETEQKIAEINK